MKGTTVDRRTMIKMTGASLPFLSTSLFAQAKRTTILVGSASGGQTDAFARTLADALSKRMGQPFIVDNKTGAGGAIAAQALVASPADGNTLMLITLGHVMTPHLMKKAPYQPLSDFAPVASLAQGGSLIVVNDSVPFKDLAGFIAYAKANPGKLNYGSAGIGSPQHLQTEYLQQALGIEMTHVPYRGAAPATLALRGGEISVLILDRANADPIIKEGKARAIAIAGVRTIPGYDKLPKVPDIAPGFDTTFWMGIVAPKGTPVAVLDKLNLEINEVIGKELAPRIEIAGLDAFPGTRADFTKFMESEDATWSQIIKKRGITVE